MARVLPVLREHGVVRADLRVEVQAYAMTALLHGLVDIENSEPVVELLQPRSVIPTTYSHRSAECC
jgi:hypothetical protein